MAGRVVYVENRCKLSYSNQYLVVERECGMEKIFIDDIDVVVLATLDISVSIWLLSKLVSEGKSVLICDERKFPQCMMLPMHGTVSAYGKWKEQSQWNKETCNSIWQHIVCDKLGCQQQVLCNNGLCVDAVEPVLLGDSTNAEGHFAAKYFHRLFGMAFHRHANDHINIALNYGYTLLTSAMARIIAGHGYNPSVGIHHCGEYNPVNLACDCVEPFRPIVDEVVHRQGDIPLDKTCKQALLSVLSRDIVYRGMTCNVHYAMERYFCDIAQSMKCNELQMGEVKLY